VGDIFREREREGADKKRNNLLVSLFSVSALLRSIESRRKKSSHV
jgi:hypothetical protein